MVLPTKRLRGSGVAALIWLASAVVAWAGDRSVNVLEGAPEPQPMGATPEQELGTPRTSNKAGLRISIRPGPLLPVGTPVTLEVSTEKPGYLVIVDINADHEASQVYPRFASPLSMKADVTNRLSPGGVFSVPDLKNPLARFELKAERPTGHGVIVALLSERPVKVVTLPRSPLPVAAVQASVDYLDKSLRSRSEVNKDRRKSASQGDWSLAAVEYIVK